MRRALTIIMTAALAIARPAQAQNHEVVALPLAAGPFAVACTNIAQDEAAIAASGAAPADFWEGREVGGRVRYITEVLAHPSSVVRYAAAVPDLREIYPRFAGETVEHVAIVCHPTPRDNPDADYVLPGAGGRVPRMQQAGAIMGTWFALSCEMLYDWRNPKGGESAQLFVEHFPAYAEIFNSHKAASGNK